MPPPSSTCLAHRFALFLACPESPHAGPIRQQSRNSCARVPTRAPAPNLFVPTTSVWCQLPRSDTRVGLEPASGSTHMVAMHRKRWSAIPAVFLATQLAACSGGESVTQTEESATCACPIEWKVDNISICGAESTAARPPLIYSSVPTASGDLTCGTASSSFPPPVPAADCSKQRISSTCASSGRLCVTLRQGDWAHPKDDDCVLARQCTAFDYAGGNELMELPPIEAWVVSDEACA